MVGSGQLGIRRVGLLDLLRDRFDGGRAVDGLLGAGDIGQPGGGSLAPEDSISSRQEMAGLVFSGPSARGVLLTASLPS